MEKTLVGSATRYIAGRNAMQTIYWRKDVDGRGLLKTTRTCFFGKDKNLNKIESGEMFAMVRERYST